MGRRLTPEEFRACELLMQGFEELVDELLQSDDPSLGIHRPDPAA